MCLDHGRVDVVWFVRRQLGGATLWQLARFHAWRRWRHCHVTCDWHCVTDVGLHSRWASCEIFAQVLERRVYHFLEVQTVIVALAHHALIFVVWNTQWMVCLYADVKTRPISTTHVVWNSLTGYRPTQLCARFKTMLFCGAYETAPQRLRHSFSCKDCCANVLAYLLTRWRELQSGDYFAKAHHQS